MRLPVTIVVAFIAGILPAASQNGANAVLDEIRTTQVPNQQKDLDTLKLASAHRERAASTEERTNGLWQSWLVSICEGCGPEKKPYSNKDVEDLMRRARSAQNDVKSPNAQQRLTYLKPTRPEKYISRVSLYTDLATENIEQIRRDPNQ